MGKLNQIIEPIEKAPFCLLLVLVLAFLFASYAEIY